MDNNFDNTPDNNDVNQNNLNQGDVNQNAQPSGEQKDAGGNASSQNQQAYTDPNAGQQTYSNYNNGQNNYTNPNSGQNQNYYGYQQTDQNNNYNYYQPGGNYQQQGQNQNWGQENYNYNVGNNTGYNRTYDAGMDQSPMSMGDWVLTILALMIPCAGIVLYFVWAFGKNGNVNRRNYCRAYLAITGVMILIYIVIFMIFGASIFASLGSYY